MSHEMVSAAPGLMCIPFLYIRLILHLLRAPYLYSVGKGYVPGVYHHPRAGTRQGDPLSPALFSLVASFVIFALQDLGPVLTVMMYADDLIIFFDGRANPQLLKRVWEVVSRFGQFSGLKVNLSKTAAIVRNCGGMEWARCFQDIGVDVKNFVKYLGVRLGNIRHQQDDQGWGLTIEQAFAPALQEAFRRARVVSTLQLSMNECAFMLTSWILPVVAWVSKAYYPPVSVIRQLKLVYHVTMGTNSWVITLPILSRPRTQGGLALPEPKLFLMHQAAAPFVSLLGEPYKFPDKAVETFYAWATTIGFTPSKDNLPYIQLGMVRTADLTFLGWSAKAHSNIQRVAPQVAPPANRDRLPLWHSVYFRNEFHCSYYNTKLIRQGVLTWGQFQSLEDARLFNALPRTWKGVYNHGGRLLNKVPSQGGFDTPAVHTQNWTRAWLLQFYASQPGVRDPQTPEVWEQLAQAQLPPRVRDFAQKALWHKLTVHARVYKRSDTDKCPVCSQKDILDVAPWWYLADLTEALAPSVHCRYIADRVRWSVGEMRTATWRLTGESVTQLIGKVYLSDSGMPPMFVISEADYEARKRRITDRPRNTDDSKTRRQGLITAGEMAKAMELDDQVDKVTSSLKRKRDLKEDEALSSNGAAQ